MSVECKALVEKHIFGDRKDFVDKQKGSSEEIKFYDQLCYGLPLALKGRKFNEVDARRVIEFLMKLHYAFQHINTLRAICVYRNQGEIGREWIAYFMNDKPYTDYFWTEIREIKSRIHGGDKAGTTMLDAILGVLFKRKDRK